MNGAVTRENSRSSCASLIAALAVSIAACALRWSAARVVDGLRGAEVGPLELLRPPKLRLAERLLGLRGLQLRDGLIELDLERPRVDDEERIALVHDLPVLEFDRGQGAADLRPQLHAVHRGELAEEAADGLHRLLQRPAHGNLGRWRRWGGRLLARAPDLLAGHGRYDRRDTEDRERAPPSPTADGRAAVIGSAGAFSDVLVAQGDVVHALTLNR